MTEIQKVELERHLKNEVSNRGKSISKNDLKEVSDILTPYYDDIDWTFEWSDEGFCYLFLRLANLKTTLGPLMKLKTIDRSVGWYMGDRNLEILIFKLKAIRLICNKSVKKQFLVFTKKVTKFLFQTWDDWFSYGDECLYYFAEPHDIPSISNYDTEKFNENIKNIFKAFLDFTQLIEDEGKINFSEWLKVHREDGGDAVNCFLTWVIYFTDCQEGFYI